MYMYQRRTDLLFARHALLGRLVKLLVQTGLLRVQLRLGLGLGLG